MSNLKDLFISQSFYGIINLENSLQPITSQSGDIQLQDGIGTNLGVKINASTKDVTIDNKLNVDDNVDIDGDLDVSGSVYINGAWIHTGSIDVLGNVTVEGDITANTASFDTINARKLNITIESASVIFSSGSNVLGDDASDVQTLNGNVFIPNNEFLKGNPVDTDTRINQKLNSGSFNAYTQSTDNRLNNLEQYTQSNDISISHLNSSTASLNAYTASNDVSITALNAFTASQLTINSGYNSFTQSIDNKFSTLSTYTSSVDSSISHLNSSTSSLNTFTASYFVDSASFDQRIDALELFSSSLLVDFVSTTKFNTYTSSVASQISHLNTSTSSLNNYTASNDISISHLNSSTASLGLYTASQDVINAGYNTFTQSIQGEVDALIAETSSYARLDRDQTFVGDQTISGSVNGNVETITIASQTASIDCSLGNFFTVSGPLPTGVVTHFAAQNIIPGQTISLRVPTQSNTTASLAPNIQMINSAGYTPTQTSTTDILTFVTFDSTTLYGVPGAFFG